MGITVDSGKTVLVEPNSRSVTITYGGPQGAKGDTGANGDLAWQDDWASDHGTYYANDFAYHPVTGRGKSLFRCILEHNPAVAATEPVVGESASTYWAESIQGGADGEGTGDFLADGTVAMTGALTMTQISTPSEPAASKTAIYPKSDGKLYYYPEGGSETEVGSGSGSGGMWADIPATPTRVSDTSFSLPDASNANLYDKKFDPGTVIFWKKSGGGDQMATITAASYSSNVVTYTIMGNTLATGFYEMKYCIHKAMQDINILPGTNPRAAATGLGKTISFPYDIYVFGARIRYGTAATSTGGTWDLNDDATSIFTTKPAIAAGSLMGNWQVADCLLSTALTAVAADSLITTDYDSGHATTPGADAYVQILYMPVAWRYRA